MLLAEHWRIRSQLLPVSALVSNGWTAIPGDASDDQRAWHGPSVPVQEFRKRIQSIIGER
jgi:hypothetical protein